MMDELTMLKGENAASAMMENMENVPEDPRVSKFTVSNPVKTPGTQGFVRYTVTGTDDEGDFSEVRRFREFFELQKVLRIRWPGCYIPSIPEKKIQVGQADNAFVEERRSLLERFMKEIAVYDYIVFSKEFKIFARGKGEVDKVLPMLPKQTPMQVLDKYRVNFKINEDQDMTSMESYRVVIKEFQAYLKKTMNVMEIQRKQIKSMEIVRARNDQCEHDFMQALMRYEDCAVYYYSDKDEV